MGQTNSKVSIVVELSIILPNGETDAQTIRYTFEERKRLTQRDLERHAIDVWCTGYEGVKLAYDTKVLDASRRPPAYVVADAYALLADGQRYRIYARANRWCADEAEEAETENPKPPATIKHPRKTAGRMRAGDLHRSEQISEAKIRKCPVCKESQLKNDHDGSCDKMTCKCGATYCYLCLEPDIRYDHFKKDRKGCQLFEDAEEFDRKRLAQLQQQLDALMPR